MTDADRVFEEQVVADRRLVLTHCPVADRAKVGVALDRLIEFSRLHVDVLEPIDTADLGRPCIGFKLRARDQVLWKVYGEQSKLEVLIRGGKSLSKDEYGEFLTAWRLIPGQQKKPESDNEVPMMSAGAVANDAIWRPLKDCLDWATKLPAKT